MGHFAASGTVHTAGKQRQRNCKQLYVQICFRVLCEWALSSPAANIFGAYWALCRNPPPPILISLYAPCGLHADSVYTFVCPKMHDFDRSRGRAEKQEEALNVVETVIYTYGLLIYKHLLRKTASRSAVSMETNTLSRVPKETHLSIVWEKYNPQISAMPFLVPLFTLPSQPFLALQESLNNDGFRQIPPTFCG